jgi:ProP effector
MSGSLESRHGGAISEYALANALRYYVGKEGYLRACREGAPRIDLSGEPAGEISAQEAAHAVGQLTARQLRQATQKKVSELALAKPELVKSESVTPEPAQLEPVKPGPKRLGLAELKTLGRARKESFGGANDQNLARCQSTPPRRP